MSSRDVVFIVDSKSISVRRAALVIGHPGHELKVFGWMLGYMPLVSILTNGSGRSGISRLPASQKVLRGIGATEGPVFGAFSDAEFYKAILERRIERFIEVAEQLAKSMVEREIDLVVADAAEGYNPTHDLCRALADAAIAITEHRIGRTIESYAFCLAEEQHRNPESAGAECLNLRLSDEVFRQKLVAASDYEEMKYEVETAIARNGKDFFSNRMPDEGDRTVRALARRVHALL